MKEKIDMYFVHANFLGRDYNKKKFTSFFGRVIIIFKKLLLLLFG